MKKTAFKIFCALLALVMLISAFPASVYASNEVNITLDVKSGEDIAYKFTQAAKLARDNSGTIYKITVPKGYYTAGSQLKLWSNTYVYLDGVTIRHTDPNSVMLRLGNLKDWENDGGYAGYSGFHNIHIYGGVFDGNGLSQALMRFGHSTDISIENTDFKNVKNTHMIEIGACSNLTIKSCSFSGFSGDWSSTRNFEALQLEVTDPKGDHFGGYPPNNDETPCKNITVKNCYFKNLQRGLGTHTGIANTYCDGIVIEGNTFENITGYAVIGTNYRYSSINYNTFKNCGSGIWFRTIEAPHINFYASRRHSNSRSTYVNTGSRIYGNSISVTPGYVSKFKNVHYGIKLEGEKVKKAVKNTPAGDFRCSGVSVYSNTVNLYCTGYGIWLSGAVKNNINANKINLNLLSSGSGGNGDGIRLQSSSNNTVSSNNIKNNSKKKYGKNVCGIVLCNSSSSNKLNSNTINKPKKDGINIQGGKSNKCSKNTITKAGRNGIALYKARKTTLTSNKIKKSKNYGIYSSLSKKKAIKKDKKNKISKSGKRARSWKK